MSSDNESVERERTERSTEDILLDAVTCGDAHVVWQAIRNGAHVDYVRDDGGNPLSEACERGDDEIAGIFLDAGADTRLYPLHAWKGTCPLSNC